MKYCGVYRKIDSLGRIVLPKDLREELSIKEEDLLNIYIENNKIIINKVNKIDSYLDKINNLSNVFKNIYNIDIIVTNRDNIINSTININDKLLNDELLNILITREKLLNVYKEIFGIKGYFSVIPIIKDFETIGLLLFISKDKNDFIKEMNLFINIIFGN